MKFAKTVFRIAGIYGLIVMTPQYFLEESINKGSSPITHPEMYYGFIGVTLVFQLVFLIIATDPSRYRPLMLVAVLEKLSFSTAVAVLFLLGRIDPPLLLFAGIDILLAILFFVARARTPVTPSF